MDREAKEYLKWVGIAALFIMVLNLVGCVRVVKPIPYVYVEDVMFEKCDTVGLCTYAKVLCSEDNRPVIMVRKSYVTGDQRLFTKAHEDAHIMQMKGDCKGISQKYKDSLAVQKRMESEAYCAEAQVRLRVQRDVQAVSSWYGSIMTSLFDTGVYACQLQPP